MSNRGKNRKNNQQNNNNNDSQQQKKKQSSNKKKLSRSNNNNQSQSRGNRGNRGGRGSRGNQSPFSRHNNNSSALPIPGSKTKRNRQRGILGKEIKKALENDSYNQKREKIKDLCNDAPFDEWNSFYSQASEQEIFQNLEMSLKSQKNIDIETHPTDYKIRGRKFIDQNMCEWQIEMFSTRNNHPKYPNHILVEFQRRDGDGFVFQQFVSSVMTDLKQAKIIAFSKYPQTDRCWLSPTPIGQSYHFSHHRHPHYDEWDEKRQNHDHGIHHNNNNNRRRNNNNNNNNTRTVNIDNKTLKMLINALFNSNDREMCRSASSWLANNIKNNVNLVNRMYDAEPMILTKFSDLLLKCVDTQSVQCIGCILHDMLDQSPYLKNQAIQLNIKRVCEKVYKRWTQPVESRFGANNKFVIKVIPSLQVAQRMQSCIEVLE